MSSAPLLQEHSLVWGQLSFAGSSTSESLFDIEAVDGSHFGNPQPVIEVVRSLLIDGALAAVTGWENREVVIRLRASANDGESLSEAEAALFSQVLMDQPYPLEWTPPLDTGATTVFDVVVARIDRDTEEAWGDDEVLHGQRYYVLTLTCLPFARAVESTTVPALPVPTDPENPVWVDVDTCGATTGWTLETGGLTTVVGPQTGTFGGETVVLGGGSPVDSSSDFIRLVRTGTINVPANHYLAVDVELDIASGSVSGHWTAYYNGVWHQPVAVAPGVGENNSTRLYWEGVGSIESVKFAFDFTGTPTNATVYVMIYNVAYTDVIGAGVTTTQRQQSRIVEVAGSAPTQAAVRLYDATPADLGTDILVYTTRSTAWWPRLRQWISSSETTAADAALISGAKHTLATPTTFLIPAELLAPGSYALLANLDVDTATTTLTWQAQIATDGGAANIVGSEVVVSGTIDLPVTTGFAMVDLAAMILPPVEVDAGVANKTVKLTLSGNANISLDEAWLFSLDDGALTWISDTEGMDWVEVRSPELGAARPSVWGGRNAVGTSGVCVDYKCESFGSHRFEPGTMQIFTIASTSLESQCELEFFPRFHSHVWGGGTS